MNQSTIEALTALATANTPWDTFQALTRAREVLGAQAEACWPLLETIAQHQTEIDRLNRLAGSDPLTGVANRRTFREALHREAARSRRTGTSFAVIMLDLDDLKQRNDQLGHAAGDRAISALARVCEQTIRPTDVVARLGGDEFAVLLSGTKMLGAEIAASRLRRAIERTVVDGIPLRTSLGTSVGTAEATDPEATVCAADKQLYKDKEKRKTHPPAPSTNAA